MSNGASSPPTIIDPTKSIIRLSAREVEDAISSFRSLLKYPTISSLASHDGSYVACAEYLLTTLRSVPCLEDARILDESEPNSLVVVAKWTGVHEDWPVILLNSHYDVVPVIVDDWTVDPFSAVRRDGRVRFFFFIIPFLNCVSARPIPFPPPFLMVGMDVGIVVGFLLV